MRDVEFFEMGKGIETSYFGNAVTLYREDFQILERGDVADGGDFVFTEPELLQPYQRL